MGVKITGLKPALRKISVLRTGFPNMLENSMEMLFEDIIDQAMENLRNKTIGTTWSRGTPNKVKLGDNLDAWEYEKIGVSAGYHQWKLWNRSDHAAPVEFGSRTPILPKGEWLNLGGGIFKKEVRGQDPKHFLGDALYYQRNKWEKNLARYMRTQIGQVVR
jgi:hypothetical protein